MTTGLKLAEYSDTPLYNIKAVVKVTEISSSTLRAWERRYNVASPKRSPSGYRLYSDRDVALIQWLKTQVDAGMSISQAVSWYDALVIEAANAESVVLPRTQENASLAQAHRGHVLSLRAVQSHTRSLDIIHRELLEALIGFEEDVAEQLMSEAFSLFTFEEVSEKLITPVLREIGDRWHSGNLDVIHEHYATNYMKQRLMTFLRTVTSSTRGPLVWIGCAPGELHELGALIVCIHLRRAGYQVRYLGQNVPDGHLLDMISRHRPDLVLFSAMSRATAENLQKLLLGLENTDVPNLVIGYGGQIFNNQPDLRANMTGVFMGSSAKEAVESAYVLLQNPPHHVNFTG